ncbi:MAG: MFS transporter [Pseudomonadales bacterium]|jgi:MFS family permease|nr:MFS transporter [Pseudomonadales bacterium]MDP6469760.1 MFS transporter [Pseudomonadales bacterium]MDP6827638.1 MFS transporter [Pseudomonadales bacterium]MDP6971921.1 MFS transporter [Pseudomonadales bacterium]|tara:strand:- start:1546 stop:3174 length:1629 start_codon:yes stop_codon:yes gene_type:complete
MSTADRTEDPSATDTGSERSTTEQNSSNWYAHYVLGVLMLVYIFNFIDRNILSILAEDIKADLAITDAQMGFLYGTVFAVFYAVFGIPLARFADVWTRRSLIALGLSFWSAMTAASGLARSFPVLAVCRVGVGIGEASASPAAYSMLSDYYPPGKRATVIAIYAAGVYIGAGIGIFLGGFILDTWQATYPTDAPWNLRGWQVAFMAVGVPGLLMALWVRTLREPVRGISEGLVAAQHPAPFKVLGREMAAVIPPLNLLGLKAHPKALRTNFLAAVGIALAAWALVWLTGSVAQWIASGVGVYVTVSWAQSLQLRDPATYALMFRSRAFVYTMLAFPTTAFVGYGAGFWIPPLMLRLHDVSATEVGMYLGLGSAMGGFVGITLGGVLADHLKRRFPGGRLILGYITILGTIPFLLWLVYTDSLATAYILNFFLTAFAASAGGVPPSTAADLVLPRMRAVAGAYFILVNTFLGLALGPYTIGLISDYLYAQGMSDAESLRMALALALLTFIPALIFVWLGKRHLPADEAARLERAKALGESADD